jgi:PKHD-type hydroxylase
MNIKPIFETNPKIDQTNYFGYTNIFSEEELMWIDNLKNLYPYQDAKVVLNEETSEDSIRKSKIKWIHYDEYSYWLYDKLKDLVIDTNSQIWQFNLHSIIDSIQYTEYYEGGGHYDWHVDIGPNPINHRKISMTIQLSDPNDYEGGDFEIWSGGDFKKVEKSKGTLILFPSFLLHRVTPITKGIRKSLVLWVGGDSYK